MYSSLFQMKKNLHMHWYLNFELIKKLTPTTESVTGTFVYMQMIQWLKFLRYPLRLWLYSILYMVENLKNCQLTLNRPPRLQLTVEILLPNIFSVALYIVSPGISWEVKSHDYLPLGVLSCGCDCVSFYFLIIDEFQRWTLLVKQSYYINNIFTVLTHKK